MTVYSIWPSFACMTVLFLLASTPVMRAADTPPSPNRNRISTLDGLRGFLALGVFFHHAAIVHLYLSSRRWESRSRFYTLLGQTGVAVFFMITGYLFWTKMIKDRGRPDWLGLYLGRLFRIGPLYWFAIGSMLTIVLIRSGFQLHEPLHRVAAEVVRWLMLGVRSPHDVNRVPDTDLILAGVTWTLRWEWFFYLSLVITAFAARRIYTHLLFTSIGLAVALVYVLCGIVLMALATAAHVYIERTGIEIGKRAALKLAPKGASRRGTGTA